MAKHFVKLALILTFGALANTALAVPTGPGGIGDTSGTSSLRLWLRADAGAIADDGFGGDMTAGDTDGIKRWEDQSGYDNNFSQGTAGNRPTFATGAINGEPTLNFVGGSTQYLSAAHFMDFSEPTIYIIGHESGGTGMALSVGAHVTTTFPKIQLRWHSNTDQYWTAFGDGGGDSQQIQEFPVAPSSTSVFHMTSYQLVNDTLTMRFNGGSLGSFTNTSYTNPVFNTGSVPTIGKDGNHTSYNLTGNLSEIIIFDGPITTIQRTMIDNAMSAKYDLTLASGDHYQGDQGAQGDYDLDVFGIGNDGTSSLTTNSSAGLSLAAASLSSGDYLLAGHKVADNGLVDEGSLIHWERTWFLDQTGSFDTTLSFDASEAGLSGTFTTLLYAASNGGPFSALDVTGVVSGDSVSFFIPAGMLPSGYYTVGLAVPEPASAALLLLGLASMGLRRRRRHGR